MMKFKDVLQTTGARRYELLSFLRDGIVGASVKGTYGSGDHRVFSPDDVCLVRLALELKRLGIGNRKIPAILSRVPQLNATDVPEMVLELLRADIMARRHR